MTNEHQPRQQQPAPAAPVQGLPGGQPYGVTVDQGAAVHVPAPQISQSAPETAIRHHPAPPAPATVSPAAVAAAAGEPVDLSPDPNRVVFSKPYQAHGDAVAAVTFRKPKGGDIGKHGVPLRYIQPEEGGNQLEMKINAAAVNNYIIELSDPPLPRSTVDQLEVDDWNNCSRIICGFFQ